MERVSQPSEAVDAFRVLGLERRLVIAEEDLRAAYDERCREVHPDAGGDPARFQELGVAYRLLLSPGQRLAHWLEREGEASEEAGALSPPLLKLFGILSALFEKIDEVTARRGEARSVLAQSLAEREALALGGELERVGEVLEARRGEFLSHFERFDRVGGAACSEEAAEVARALRFLEKWQGQLRERFVRLAG